MGVGGGGGGGGDRRSWLATEPCVTLRLTGCWSVLLRYILTHFKSELKKLIENLRLSIE